jgi:hypothetical protein
MKTVRTSYMASRVALFACCGLLTLFHAPRARADMMLTSQTNMVLGSMSEDYGFTVPYAGTVVAKLTPFEWPDQESMASLNFLATTTSAVLTSFSATPSGTTSATFDVSPGVNYYTHILGTAGGPLQIGLFSYSLTFTPAAVPIPGTLWMLIAGIIALGAACVFGSSSRLTPDPALG